MRLPNDIENLDEWKSEFSFSTDIKIRFSETDMIGHVDNISPFIYLEEARTEYFNSLEYSLDDSSGSIPIVADLQCDYLKELYFGDKLKVYVKVATAGTSSIDIHYLGVNEKEEICLTGRVALVNVNRATKKAEPLREELKKKMLESKISELFS